MYDLISLPLDVKRLIYGYLSLLEDWINVCTVCKDCYSVTIALVYHTLDISDDLDIGKASQLLNPDNAGLKEVRRVRLRCSQPFRSKNDGKRDHVLNLLTKHLPRDILLSVRIDTQRPIDQTILDALHNKQRWLQTFRCEANVIRQVPEGLDLSRLSAIQLFVRTDERPETVHSVLNAAYNLNSLEICVGWDEYLNLTYPNGPDWRNASDSLIANLLGESQEEGSSHKPSAVVFRALSTLRIRGIDLSLAGTRIFRAIRPSTLKSLGLQHCQNETSLLRLMTTPHPDDDRALQIRHLEIVHSRTDWVPGPASEDDSIDDFLNCFNTLETLVIFAPGSHRVMASASSISNHHSGLRTLYLEYGDGLDAWCHPGEDLSACFRKCKKIKQLALNFPQMDYVLVYGVNSRTTFRMYLDALEELPDLRTLRVLNLPTAETLDWTTHDPEIAVSYAKYALKDVAIAMFEAMQFEGESVVSFGKNDYTIYGRRRLRRMHTLDFEDEFDDDDDEDGDDNILSPDEEDGHDPKVYLKATLAGPRESHVYPSVVEVEVNEAQDVQPISTILNVDVDDTNTAFIGYDLEQLRS